MKAISPRNGLYIRLLYKSKYILIMFTEYHFLYFEVMLLINTWPKLNVSEHNPGRDYVVQHNVRKQFSDIRTPWQHEYDTYILVWEQEVFVCAAS